MVEYLLSVKAFYFIKHKINQIDLAIIFNFEVEFTWIKNRSTMFPSLQIDFF